MVAHRDETWLAFSLILLLHSSKSLTVPRMEMKLGTHMCNIVSMTTTNSLRYLVIHSSNLLTAAHMEMKLGTHAYYIISMTTTDYN